MRVAARKSENTPSPHLRKQDTASTVRFYSWLGAAIKISGMTGYVACATRWDEDRKSTDFNYLLTTDQLLIENVVVHPSVISSGHGAVIYNLVTSEI